MSDRELIGLMVVILALSFFVSAMISSYFKTKAIEEDEDFES